MANPMRSTNHEIAAASRQKTITSKNRKCQRDVSASYRLPSTDSVIVVVRTATTVAVTMNGPGPTRICLPRMTRLTNCRLPGNVTSVKPIKNKTGAGPGTGMVNPIGSEPSISTQPMTFFKTKPK